MKTNSSFNLSIIYLRLAIALAYLWEVVDRLGVLGKHGMAHVGWGDWTHFITYARTVMAFLPDSWIPFMALIATIAEGLCGILLLLGLFTKWAAIGSGFLSLAFAISMGISFGIESPIGYSVFTLSAASFLLAKMPTSSFSLDAYRTDLSIN